MKIYDIIQLLKEVMPYQKQLKFLNSTAKYCYFEWLNEKYQVNQSLSVMQFENSVLVKSSNSAVLIEELLKNKAVQMGVTLMGNYPQPLTFDDVFVSKRLTPLEIEILLHYHYSTKDFPDLEAPAIKDAINKFCQHGILRNIQIAGQDNTIKFIANKECLNLYMDKLTSVELPKWQ